MKKLPKNNPMTTKNKSGLFALISCIGVVATGVTTFIATRKSEKILNDDKLTKREKFKKAAPYFIGPTLIGLVSIGCGATAQIKNIKTNKELAAYAGSLGSILTGYRKGVIERYGEEIDEEIFYSVRGELGSPEFHKWNVDTPDKIVRWHDWATDTWFEKYEREILDAELHFNRNYVLGASAGVVQWADMLGVTPNNICANYGWSTCSGIYFIDFDHIKMEDEKGVYYEIVPVLPPEELEDEW